MSMHEQILDIQNLIVHFDTDRGSVSAINDVSFQVNRGEIIGIVGESGSGKTVMSQSILRLLDHSDSIRYEGKVLFDGDDLLQLDLQDLQKVRGNKISMIFQDPSTSLNPVYSIGNQIIEVLRLHQNMTKTQAQAEAISLLRKIGIPSPEQRMKEFPHQLSGGMQQRIMIAIALACKPSLLIADEPTTALDVTVQAQILDLMLELNRESDMGILFISHDLGVISQICHKVKVMYLGQIVEELPINQLFDRPLHPYTIGLIKSIPTLELNRAEDLYTIKGTVPSLYDRPLGCSFANRCPFATNRCINEEPKLRVISEGHTIRCFYAEQIERGEIIADE